MKRTFLTFPFLLLLAACATQEIAAPATPESELSSSPKQVESGFLGIDKGNYDGSVKSLGEVPKGDKGKGVSVLDKLLGSGFDPSGFDPNRISAPNYAGAKYKSKVSKQLLLEELMDSAYDAYTEVSGKRWYPKRVNRGVKSNDPLLRKDRWLLRQGQDLQDSFYSWGKRAQWQIVWRSDYAYPVRVGALFRGSFPNAVSEVLEKFEDRQPRLYATFYKNRVVVFRNEAQK